MSAAALSSAPTSFATSAPIRDSVLSIPSERESLPAIVSAPLDAAHRSGVAVLIVVGGPQYRVGSHRQFVQLARALACRGHVACRFDLSGMGDAPGPMQSFEDSGPDLDAAVKALRASDDRIDRVVLWGLCDAASSILMHGCADRAVAGVVLANPWVRSQQTLAAATVKHYYRDRLMRGEFWRKLLSGGVNLGEAARSLHGNLKRWLGPAPPATTQDFRQRMAAGLRQFGRPVLLILSGDDLTAREFNEHALSDPAWRGLLNGPLVQRVELAHADHTFSRRQWKTEVERLTFTWIEATLCQ